MKSLHTIIVFPIMTLTTLTTASNTNTKPIHTTTTKAGSKITTSQLLAIAPKSRTCTNAPIPSECATASQATHPLNTSFEKYNISSLAEKAAVLGLIIYESESFRYDRNHFPPPGRAGQGSEYLFPAGVFCFVSWVVLGEVGLWLGLTQADMTM